MRRGLSSTTFHHALPDYFLLFFRYVNMICPDPKWKQVLHTRHYVLAVLLPVLISSLDNDVGGELCCSYSGMAIHFCCNIYSTTIPKNSFRAIWTIKGILIAVQQRRTLLESLHADADTKSSSGSGFRFETSEASNATTVQVGSTAYLHCPVANLGEKEVIFPF